MPNPFLGEATSHGAPSAVTNPQGDGDWFGGTPYHVAGLLLLALVVLTALQIAGFRAMVGIGRS